MNPIIHPQLKHSASVVHKGGNRNRASHLRFQLDALSLQIHHCDGGIRFTVIEFTWRLISSVRRAREAMNILTNPPSLQVLSLSTTYLLVLIQFNRLAVRKLKMRQGI